MPLSMEDRDRMRARQDRLLRLADRYHFDHSMRVSVDMPASITIHALESLIFPEYEREIESVINNLEGLSRNRVTGAR